MNETTFMLSRIILFIFEILNFNFFQISINDLLKTTFIEENKIKI